MNDEACECLERISEQTTADVEPVFATINEYVIPVLGLLCYSSIDDDGGAVEDVRGKWCSLLNLPIPGTQRQGRKRFISGDLNQLPKFVRVLL